MNEKLEIIKEQEVLGKSFRIYGTFETPLFLAKDVAEWIGHSDTSTMLRNVDEDEKLIQTMFVSGQNRDCWFLTEDGLYEVLMQSRKPIAKEFKKEVKKFLKKIRVNGIYSVENKKSERELDLLEDSNRIEKAKLIEKIGENSPVQSYKNICAALAVNIAANGNYLPLPKPEHKTYKATELANEFGVTPQIFGVLANKYNVKNSKNGEIIWNLGRNGKQVENFVYYESGKKVMKNLCLAYKSNKR